MRSQPTILQIIPNLDTGGAELATVEIAAALVAAGARALIATEGGRLADRLRAAGGEIVPLPVASKNPATIIRNVGRLAELVEREGVNLLHARSRAPAWSALFAARRTKRAFVTTYHGAYKENGQIKRLYNSVMARSDVVIANSRYTADLIHSRYATPRSRIAVIYRGIDEANYIPSAVPAQRVEVLRKAWGMPGHHRIVLQAARLTSWKGQSVLIEAAARLAKEGRLENVAVVLAGDAQGRDDYIGELRGLIERSGLTGIVHLVGHVDDIAAAFLASYVAVVASVEPEAFGRAAAEAQAMNCPVIATRIGAPQETVLAEPAYGRDQRTGWLVPPGNAAALASALGEALDLSDGERAAMGRKAAAHVTANFSLRRMQMETLAVYDRLLSTRLSQQLGSS
ncbi:MAG: hypothetical protein RLZ98_3673 [Pseudomonadota bacterium]|jgi:glycosyltransferase involved in cell wall biosynthesis